MNNDCQQDIKDEDDRDENNNGICQTLQLGILHQTKYESSLEYKAIYNCATSYLITLIMTSSNVLDNQENDLTNTCL